MANDVEAQVADLERRIQALEDELAITNLMHAYGPAVDTGNADATGRLYTEDTIYETDAGRPPMVGREGVQKMVTGRAHQSLLPNCAHTMGPAIIKVDGDKATATGYSRVYVRKDKEFTLWRLSTNRWEFERRGGRWQVHRRENALVGTPKAQEIFTRGLQD